MYAPAQEFFRRLNETLQVTNLPIHSEFRLHNGHLMPIELNSFRFGGMGLGNLGYPALGINSYQHFMDDTEPDWDSIWADRENIFGFFIAYNSANSDLTQTAPDWQRLRRQFSRSILETPFDYQNQLAFGILYIEERPENRLVEDRVRRLLCSAPSGLNPAAPSCVLTLDKDSNLL